MNYQIVVELANKTKAGFRGIEKNLDGLDKKAKGVGGNLKKLANPAIMAAKAIAAIATAAIAASAALVTLSIKNATVISQMRDQAKIAGIGTSEFQKLAFAAKSVGVEQDKLSDIFKDVNDKVADFLITGGGPMKDFFETVGPKVGVTADQFKNLSGPQALQLYVDSLEKANVSQAEMTFFMEAIASDATALVPLLKDGGAGFEEMGRKAMEMGLILDEVGVKKVTAAKESFDTLKSVMSSVGDQITAGLAPGLQAVSEYLTNLAVDNMPAIQSIAEKVFSGMVTGIGYVVDGLAWLGNNIEIIRGTFEVLGGAVGTIFYGIEEVFVAVFNKIIEGINKLKSGINDLTNIKVTNPLTGNVIFESEGTKLSQTPGFSTSGGFDQSTGLMQTGADRIANAGQGMVDIIGGNGPGSQMATEILEAAEANKIAAETMAALDKTTQATTKSTKTLADTIDTGSGTGGKSVTDAMKAAKKEAERLRKEAEKAAQKIIDMNNEMASNLGNAIGESLRNGEIAFDSFRDVAMKAISSIIQHWIANQSIFQQTPGINGGGGLNALGSLAGAIFGGLFAKGGSLPTGQYGIAGEAGPELIKGPVKVHSNQETMSMLGGNGGGNVYAPVFNTTIQSSGGDDGDGRKLAEQFNKTIEAKVADSMQKFQNRNKASFMPGRSY